MRYDWPGNIRELQHEITRLMLMVETDLVDDVDLEHRILSSSCGFDVYDSPFKDAWKQNKASSLYNFQIVEQLLEHFRDLRKRKDIKGWMFLNG